MRTEQLLTTAEGFDLTTATPAQRVICRLLDGQPLADLAHHEHARALVGGADALAAATTVGRPSLVVVLASVRSAKTMIALCAAVRMALSVDCSPLKAGEVPRVSILSLRLDTASEAMGMLLGMLHASPVLSRLVITSTADTVTLRHPSGRPVEIAIVAGAKAGAGLVARWSAGVIFDEAPRMNGSEDGVVNLDHALDAVHGRLLDGAQILLIGSPWRPAGPVYDLVTEHWQKPSTDVLIIRGTGPMLNPERWTDEVIETLRRRRPNAHRTDVLGEFADPDTGLLSADDVEQATRSHPHELPPEGEGGGYAAAVDPSGGGATANAATLVIVQAVIDERGGHRYRVALAREWRGVSPESYFAEMAAICHRYHLSAAYTDNYASQLARDLALRHGLQLTVRGGMFSDDAREFAALLAGGRIELSPEPQLKTDLLSMRRRPLQNGGEKIHLPKTADGRHADYAPAICAAVAVADFWSRAQSEGAHDTDLRLSSFGPDGRIETWDSRDEAETSETDAQQIARWERGDEAESDDESDDEGEDWTEAIEAERRRLIGDEASAPPRKPAPKPKAPEAKRAPRWRSGLHHQSHRMGAGELFGGGGD